MLKLLIFAPCERIIVSTEKTASLISVMESVQFTPEGEVPPDALAPVRWGVMAYWRREGEVDGVIEFEQRIDVLRPDGELVTGGTNVFKVSSKNLNYRNTLNLDIMPVGLAGDILVKLRLRQTNPETEWRDIAEYPILVVHHVKEADEKSAAENAQVG
jgi:hypothetical protein